MRLADFIIDNLETILDEWEAFAKTILPAATVMNSAGLRDHAEQMLSTIAADLRTRQSAKEQYRKSQGNAPASDVETPAETHAVDRHVSGFTLDQMVSEYRALRASVLNLWLRKNKGAGDYDIEDLMRFNEAVDQALAESVASYSRAAIDARNVYLGILGHDLRSPLSAIMLCSELLVKGTKPDDKSTRMGWRILNSVSRANKIVEDLLDFIRSQLGTGIPVNLKKIDFNGLCQNLVDETNAANPGREVRFHHSGSVSGYADASRIGQVLSNLMGNALKHGSPQQDIDLSLTLVDDEALIEVANKGKPISDEVLPFIFNLMSSHSQYLNEGSTERPGLGLGLYIVSEIVAAHGGRIDVKSDLENGTIFSVWLPLGKRPT